MFYHFSDVIVHFLSSIGVYDIDNLKHDHVMNINYLTKTMKCWTTELAQHVIQYT